MITKATFAAVFIIMAFDMDDLSSVLISLLLSAGFFIWAVFPFLKYRQNIQEMKDTVEYEGVGTKQFTLYEYVL